MTGVASADGRVVAVGHDEQGQARVWHREEDGEWVGSAPSGDVSGASALGIAASPSGFVIVGYRETVTEAGTVTTEEDGDVQAFDRRIAPAAWTTTDGRRWVAAQTPDADAIVSDVAASGSGLLAVGSALDGETAEGVAPYVLASEDGQTWREVSASGLPDTPEGGLEGVAYQQGAWYALSLDIEGAALWRSADGSSWSEHASFAAGDGPTALAEGPQGLLAVGATIPDAQARFWRVTGGGAKEQRLPSSVSDKAVLRDVEPVSRGRAVVVGQQDGRPLAADAER